MPGISSVPTIDVSRLDDPKSKRQALATLEQACTDWGAFYISGAPIGENELQNAARETKAFFEQPTERKMEIALENAPSVLGYVPVSAPPLLPSCPTALTIFHPQYTASQRAHWRQGRLSRENYCAS